MTPLLFLLIVTHVLQLDQFGTMYQKLADLHEVRFDQIVLSLNDVLVQADKTPADLNITIVDIISKF